MGVCFSHLFMRFAGGLALVRISGLSVIARCPQGQSRLDMLLHGIDGTYKKSFKILIILVL